LATSAIFPCHTSLVPDYSAIILAVAHDQFKEINLIEQKEMNCIIYDVKSFLDKDVVTARL